MSPELPSIVAEAACTKDEPKLTFELSCLLLK